MELWNEVIVPAFQKILQDIIIILPKFIAAAVILLAGFIIAKIFEGLARRILKKIGFNKLSERTGIEDFLKNAGFNREISWLIGRLIYWMLILVFLLSAAETLELTALALSIEKVVSYIPNLIVVILILVFGAMLARFAGRLVRATAMDAEIDFADFLGKLVNNVVLLVVIVLAFSQLELESNVLDTTFAALIGAAGLAAALTLGLGTRKIAYNIICGVYARKTYRLGQKISLEDVSGEVVQMGTVNSIIRTDAGLLSIANANLIEKKTLMPVDNEDNSSGPPSAGDKANQ